MPLNTLIPDANVGTKVVWWAFTSTSNSKDAPKRFINSTGTLFQISSNDGRNISRYSSTAEEEVILLPGSQFVIDVICPYASTIEEVRMHQLNVDYGSSDGADGNEPVYAEPVDPPVYDETGVAALHDDAASAGAAPPVEYATYAGSTELGPNTAVYADVDTNAHYENDGIVPDDAGGAGAAVGGGAAAPSHAPSTTVQRCGKCQMKVRQCMCDVRRNTTDMIKSKPRGCVQQTSSGKCLLKAAGKSARCAGHTCQHPGCFGGKSSKLKFCKKHTKHQQAAGSSSNQQQPSAQMNPAFMLADSAGAGGFIPAVYDLGIPSTSTIVYAVPIEGDNDALYESADQAQSLA